MENKEFANKTAIITGAASGIGLMCAQRLAEDGANVVMTDANGDALHEKAAELAGVSGDILPIQVDVRDYAQVSGSVKKTIDRFGGVDILINCAGGASGRVHGIREWFCDMPIEVIDWGLDVNLKGPVYFAHAAVGHMLAQRSGVIINLGSISGVAGSESVDYSTAKSGVMNGLTQSLALHCGPYGVRVCCVSPGPVLTRPAMANMKTALGRAAQPKEIVDLILYLCSEKAAFITGANYLIDGGRSCGDRESFGQP